MYYGFSKWSHLGSNQGPPDYEQLFLAVINFHLVSYVLIINVL